MTDHVDAVLREWGALHPDLDLRGMAILGRVKRLTRVLERLQADVLRAHGVQESDVDVLAPLYRAGEGLRPRELRRAMLIGSGTLTARLDRLEQAGLVERRADPTDRRGRVIHLTPAGRDLAPRVVADLLEVENTLLADLDAGDREALVGGLAALLARAELVRDDLDRSGSDGPPPSGRP